MGEMLLLQEVNRQIDAFVERTKALDGTVVVERGPWNRTVTEDSIRHVAAGIADDNPLWLDRNYGSTLPRSRLSAPPAYLCSVMYPMLHGAPLKVPLSSLIGALEYRYFLPVLEGDRLRGVAVQRETYEKQSSTGRRLVFIISDVTYTNQRDEVVATARGTMIRATQVGEELLLTRPLHRPGDHELRAIDAAIRSEKRTGSERVNPHQLTVGSEIPGMVRGPLTIGDMVCWQAAIGPSYRAGGLGYLDCMSAPHTAVTNPVTGWPVKYSQQHEDAHLAVQRGMPGPFDNGVMRFAWVSPLITNWMGDGGTLRRLNVQVRKPHIYGDVVWYSAHVSGKQDSAGGTVVTISVSGRNQLGEVTTTADADVLLN